LTQYSVPKITKKNKRPSRQRTSNNGFRSGFESKLAHQLERGGIRYKYETLQIEYQKVSTYTPDFILPNGIIIEAKGLWTTEDRKKHLLVREQHPQLDIRIVFQSATNKIRKGSNTTYAGWCEKKGIKYANKLIPESWLLQQPISPVIDAGRLTVSASTTMGAHTASSVTDMREEKTHNE